MIIRTLLLHEDLIIIGKAEINTDKNTITATFDAGFVNFDEIKTLLLSGYARGIEINPSKNLAYLKASCRLTEEEKNQNRLNNPEDLLQ